MLKTAPLLKVLNSSLNIGRSFQTNLSPKMSKYCVVEKGTPNTSSYRMFITNSDVPISPFHDIPLLANADNKIYNMVVEIPRWSNAKMEIATKEPLNPIKQDTKKDVLRYVKNCFPHKGYIWNYGALPQTWEDPNHLDDSTGCRGDNDPIDVCEIGDKVHKRGAVIQVKVLGVFALVDEGETDWKVIAIDVNDPLAKQLNDIEDVDRLKTGLLKATHEWFKIYKVPDGKPENKFAFDGKPKDKSFAEKVIVQTHEHWKKLITSAPDAMINTSGLDLKNITIGNSPYKIDNPQAVIDAAPALAAPKEISDSEQVAIDKWYVVG